MESSYCQQAVTFFFFFNLQLVWPPHFLACSTAPAVITYAHLELELLYTLYVIKNFETTTDTEMNTVGS